MTTSRVHGHGRHAAVAAIDLSDALFTAVALNSSGQYVRPAAGAIVFGVVYETAPTGRPATTAIAAGTNLIKWQAGATVAINALVMTNASGLAVTATTGNTAVGICVQGGANGEILQVSPISPRVVA